MKKKMDGSEAILVEDFLIEDILEDAQSDDVHARLRCEMHKFTDKLMSEGLEGRDGDGGEKTALVHQGTIIILLRNKRRFTLPNIHSLGPKILQIIAQHQQQYPALALVNTTHIRAVLVRDHLLTCAGASDPTHSSYQLSSVPPPSYGLPSINRLGGGGQQPAGSSTSTSGQGIKGRALKVRFDNALASSGTAATTTHNPPSSWPNMIPGLPPPNSHPIHPGQPHSDCPLIQDPTQHSERIEANSVYSSSASVDQDKPNKSQSNLWAPNPVRPTVRVSVPTIVPPALSPIASRQSSYFKSNNNGTSEYSQTSSDGGQGTSSQSGTGPEPIGHPTSSQPRPQTIPMPPRYAPGLVSPALPKTIQMTPSMPAFSFQPFMPATPPLLPNFFSPGIGPPPTPPYGRDGNHTPPPCPAKPPG
ncbi:hypothetical protein PCANC_11026 [Puccinia coronata f. sp. avenae]|uniref:Uncharacterized protein n=1 Tax=Puccinia coronata f. sp. avenae TaxID=200324 RepID=A0A2N5USV6_9BASI|nr:hypothetical protein PCANC_11026 [Puccinia coronata f. sp. avenae]